ncbi:hypothetical protein, partial [Bradyrhizobium sp. NAS96.2]|uniref:hypothetical protein n=1 Tax=Bradyrhizobium sp. NAS96.2 TaxID=1680160 RepID=UPI001AECABFE
MAACKMRSTERISGQSFGLGDEDFAPVRASILDLRRCYFASPKRGNDPLLQRNCVVDERGILRGASEFSRPATLRGVDARTLLRQ